MTGVQTCALPIWANLLERQREGIALAKAAGKYKGRREIKIDHFPEHYERYRTRQVTKSQLARELGISRPTLDKLIANYLSNSDQKKQSADL